MNARDEVLGFGESWIGIVPLGDACYVHNTSKHTLKYRFGISSTSKGIMLYKDAHIKVDTVVYFKDSSMYNGTVTIIDI